MLLLIDNYDSFTFNLVQALEEQGARVVVVRSGAMSAEQCLSLNPRSVVIGPGPGNPENAGVSNALITQCAGKIPLLGVCLGLQCIATVYGGQVKRSGSGPMHGKTSQISHRGEGVFASLPNPFTATRYHSLAIEPASLPAELTATAWSEDGEIMGISHRAFAVEGVQFHPESVLTRDGAQLIKNFLHKEQPI